MEDDDGLADDDPIKPLLPPDDRLWRHPSEVASAEPGPPQRGARVWPVAILAGLIGALLGVGTLGLFTGFPPRTETVRTVVERVRATPSPVAAGSSIVDIAERMQRSVVQVRPDEAEDATGSAVLFRSDGHALTTARVVGGLRTLLVVLADGTQRRARVVGVDRDTDLAVLKIDGPDLRPAPLSGLTNLKVGQVAIAVGSSVSVGVVSAVGRTVDVPQGPALLEMIQTDAPICPGCVGGALVDDTGAVIGITTSVAGEGFATPIDVARDVAQQLLTVGRVVRAWLGIDGDDLDLATSQRLGLDGAAVVRVVMGGSPAEAAGITPRDVITAIDSRHVASMAALKSALRQRRPGQAVELRVLRDGRERVVRVTLTERPER